MIFYSDSGHTKRRRARDGQPMLASSAVRRQRPYSGLTGKETRRLKNRHRRHRKNIDKSNIHWTNKPTRKDILRKQRLNAAQRAQQKRRGWFGW